MRKLGKGIFTAAIALLIIVLLLLSLSEDRTERASPSDNVRIDNLKLCEINASESGNTVYMQICGNVVSDKNIVPLRMYIYKTPQMDLVAENTVDDKFAAGEFTRLFGLQKEKDSETFKLVVYFYKEIIGELNFDIADN